MRLPPDSPVDCQHTVRVGSICLLTGKPRGCFIIGAHTAIEHQRMMGQIGFQILHKNSFPFRSMDRFQFNKVCVFVKGKFSFSLWAKRSICPLHRLHCAGIYAILCILSDEKRGEHDASFRYPKIETSWLLLRPLLPEDAPMMFDNWASDPEVTRWLRWEPHTSPAETWALLSAWAELYPNPDYYQWAMVEKSQRPGVWYYFHRSALPPGDAVRSPSG